MKGRVSESHATNLVQLPGTLFRRGPFPFPCQGTLAGGFYLSPSAVHKKAGGLGTLALSKIGTQPARFTSASSDVTRELVRMWLRHADYSMLCNV